MKPSDCRTTSHFTRAWESTLISICFSNRGFEARTPGLWRFSLEAPSPLPVLCSCSKSCLPALLSQKGHCAYEEQSNISLLWFSCSTQWYCGGSEGSASALWPVGDCSSSHFLKLCANVKLLKGWYFGSVSLYFYQAEKKKSNLW